MKDAIVEFEVLNWEKYNPRTDAKHCTWFRLDASIFENPDVSRLSPSGFKLYIYMLSKALRMRGVGRELLTRLTRECSIRSRATLERYLEELQASGIIKYELRLHSNPRPLRNDTNGTNETIRNSTNLSHSLIQLKPEDPPNLDDSPPSVSEKKIENDFSETERAVIDYAETKLDRIVSQAEAENFVAEWRQKPKLSADRIRKAIDWVAAHPLARIETRSIARLLHDSQARQAYFEWDKRILRDVNQMLATGIQAPEVVAKMVQGCGSLDPEVFRAYLERICGICSDGRANAV